MADHYPHPNALGESIPCCLTPVLPAAAVSLLQDLAYQFGPSHSDIPLPAVNALANVSPLPLPVPLLLHLGVLQPESHLIGGSELRHATGDWWTGKATDIFTLPRGDPKECKTISLPRETLDTLRAASVSACLEIVTQARAGRGGAEWKNSLSNLDVSRIAQSLESALDAHGMGVRLVLEDVHKGPVTVEEAD